MAELNGIEGVWRTVGGRHIFIKQGQDLTSAMKESGKFSKKENQEKTENKMSLKDVRNKIKELSHDIHTKDLTDEEKNKMHKEIEELKKTRDKMVEQGLGNEDKSTTTTFKDEKDIIELSQKTIDDIADNIENQIDHAEGYASHEDIDDFIINNEEYQKLAKNYVKQFDLDDLEDDWYDNQYKAIEDQVYGKLEELGITSRYKNGKTIFDRVTLGQKGYDDILNILDKNNIFYDISRSWNSGDFPSIYIKDSDGNIIFRIANHFNNYINEKNKIDSSVYNKIFSQKDYANYKENILPTLEKILKENDIDIKLKK